MISENKEPSSKFGFFMEKSGWTIVSTVLGGIILSVITTLWLGTVRILNFSWLVLILAIVQLIITIFLVWYFQWTKRKLEIKYQADTKALQKELALFKKEQQDEQTKFEQNYTQLIQKDRDEWNKWLNVFIEARAKERKEDLETVRSEYKQHISEARLELLGTAKSYFDHTTDWQHLHVENSHRLIEQTFVSQLRSIRQLLKDASIDQAIDESLTKEQSE